MRKPANWNVDIALGSIADDMAYRFDDPLMGIEMYGDSLGDVDPDVIRECIESAKLGEAKLRQFRLRLEAHLDGQRLCECGTPIAGRSDRRYCSSRCRVRAHRAEVGDHA